MIAFIKGEVIEREEKALVVMTGGVGYRVRVTSGLRNKFGIGDKVSLRIFHHISSDNQTLFGFEEQEELVCFELLITVPSVGPRTAIGILEIAPPRILEQAVAEDDMALLNKVSGVGKKTAQRILVELKGKIKEPSLRGAGGNIKQEAVEALVSIGFTKQQARDAVQELPKDVGSTEEAVRAALQRK